MKRNLAIALVLVCAVLALPFIAQLAAPNYSETLPRLDGLAMVDVLQIARGGKRQSGLWIVCSTDRRFRLGYNTRFPMEASYARNETLLKLDMEINVLRNEVRQSASKIAIPRLALADATWRRDDDSDVVFTQPLSADDIRTLTTSFDPVAPPFVIVVANESRDKMTGEVDGKSISEFSARCARRAYTKASL